MTLRKEALENTVGKKMISLFDKGENTVGKGENAGNQHFLLFPQCFLLYQRKKEIITAAFNLSSANAVNLELSKNLSFVKELIIYFCVQVLSLL